MLEKIRKLFNNNNLQIEDLRTNQWKIISYSLKLPEKFIEKFKDEVHWGYISARQTLSEPFIEKFKDKVNWYYISYSQTLSEPFIEKFQDYVCWEYISEDQKLSESFIEKFKDKVDWGWISESQKLSEPFIEKFKDYVDWSTFTTSQKFSKEFIEKFKDKFSNSWMASLSKEEKLKTIKEYYEIDGDYIIAYKSTRDDGSSVYAPDEYLYEVGKTYSTNKCDCNAKNENSFGLAAWTKEEALSYYPDGKLFKVKIHIDDIGTIVQDGSKIRCFKLEVIEKI